MDSPPDSRVSLRVSPVVYLAGIALGAVLVAVLGVLIAVLVVLEDSRTHIQAQDHKIAKLQGGADPLLAEARPAVRQAEPLIKSVRRLISPAGESLESLTTATDSVPRLVMGADLLLTQAIPLLRSLHAADAPGAIVSVSRLTDSLAAGDRAVRMVDGANDALGEIDRTNLIPRASGALPRFAELLSTLVRVQKRTLRTQDRTLRTQKVTLRTQRRTTNLLFESIRIQREILEHTRSIDRKIPGPTAGAPASAPPTPAAPAVP